MGDFIGRDHRFSIDPQELVGGKCGDVVGGKREKAIRPMLVVVNDERAYEAIVAIASTDRCRRLDIADRRNRMTVPLVMMNIRHAENHRERRIEIAHDGGDRSVEQAGL
ncbi:hypothetical protein [Sphingopyxis bauzanensis]|uniref:hypothetical protein n=1 Tax=Sphingopyxis bauzanensis TaxID=651663 RepID=UPI0013031B87|nr:hypothetical protein [Sphingopyxis bauzanensis]